MCFLVIKTLLKSFNLTYFSWPGIRDISKLLICFMRSTSTKIRAAAISDNATAAHERDNRELAVDLWDENWKQ